jgi:hypothetical protein
LCEFGFPVGCPKRILMAARSFVLFLCGIDF